MVQDTELDLAYKSRYKEAPPLPGPRPCRHLDLDLDRDDLKPSPNLKFKRDGVEHQLVVAVNSTGQEWVCGRTGLLFAMYLHRLL